MNFNINLARLKRKCIKALKSYFSVPERGEKAKWLRSDRKRLRQQREAIEQIVDKRLELKLGVFLLAMPQETLSISELGKSSQ